MPPLENLSSKKVLPDFVTGILEDDQLGKKDIGSQTDVAGTKAAVYGLEVEEKLRDISLEDCVVEPKTGFKFPVTLISSECQNGSGSGAQVLAGVGVRSISIIKLKTIKIYAFGFYINSEVLRAELGEKYGKVPPEELKFKSAFYEDLLSHELEMTVRIVVHYKRIKVAMVRSAFENSIKNRLRKLKGVENDGGLRVFCSYFTEELSLPHGTVIDFHWQRGGKFTTIVGGHLMGTIVSLDFCRAFFDLYIGEPPVCAKAKQDMGLKLGNMLWAS